MSDDAATIFDDLELPVLVEILDRMNDRKAAPVGPFESNLALAKTLRGDWTVGRNDPGAARVDVILDDGNELPALGGMRIVHAPGHTAGSISLYFPNRGMLLVGDAMFPGDTLFAGSMGRTDLPGGNDAQMLASLRRLAQIEGDYTVYPGHMNSTTLAREKAMNPYLRHALR